MIGLLEVLPLLQIVTVVAIFGFLFSQIDKNILAEWIVGVSNNEHNLLKKLDLLIKERKSIEFERDSISAQDQYAKWTKLNRKFDKINLEITEISSNVKAEKSNKINKISNLIVLLQKLPLNFIKFWYARSPVIIIHSNSLFNFFGIQRFVLNMPFGKRNTISTIFWCFAIEQVLGTIKTFINDLREYRRITSVKPVSN